MIQQGRDPVDAPIREVPARYRDRFATYEEYQEAIAEMLNIYGEMFHSNGYSRNEILSYIAATREEALATCKRINPKFHIMGIWVDESEPEVVIECNPLSNTNCFALKCYPNLGRMLDCDGIPPLMHERNAPVTVLSPTY